MEVRWGDKKHRIVVGRLLQYLVGGWGGSMEKYLRETGGDVNQL
jgi:hypothetical protein